MSKETGGPAFPCTPKITPTRFGDHAEERNGVSIRDYFAAKAMQGMLVNAERNGFSFSAVDKISDAAYEMADAMLAVRNK